MKSFIFREKVLTYYERDRYSSRDKNNFEKSKEDSGPNPDVYLFLFFNVFHTKGAKKL
jgi:hypothetical protein